MTHDTRHTDVITAAIWQTFPGPVRAALRRRFGGKAAIVDHQVLEIAQALCDRGAYDLALAFYQALDGQPPLPYQGCGLGLLITLRERMGEAGPDPTETMLLRE
jgi:hypothetical protein